MSIEQLIHATVKIDTGSDRNVTGSGTGFFYAFPSDDPQGVVPVIVTNRHVVEGNDDAWIHVNLRGPDGQPMYGNHERVYINHFQQSCILHPDPTVDLAILPCGAFLNNMRNQNRPVHFSFMSEQNIPQIDTLNDLSALERVIMIGYPVGIWDDYNNLPVVRQGSTATPLYINYRNKREFMIDMACFPGSSGSPVFIYNAGSYTTRDGSTIMGQTRVLFVGILYAGPTHNAQGEIRIVDIPTSQVPIALSRIPTNLGYCIKADRLFEFQDLLRAEGHH